MVNALSSVFGPVFRGRAEYYAWIIILGALIALGISVYLRQVEIGLVTAALRDQVSLGFCLSYVTFLVGVAAAAALLVIPMCVCHFKPIKEIILFGGILTVAAIAMCVLSIMVDVGQLPGGFIQP